MEERYRHSQCSKIPDRCFSFAEEKDQSDLVKLPNEKTGN